MFRQFARKRAVRAVAAIMLLMLMVPWTAFADDISNNLDASIDAVAEVMSLNVGGSNGTTQLYVTPRNGDGKNGCNLTGSSTLVISVDSSDTSVATVSPSSITFSSCGDTPTLTVTPHNVGAATVSVSQTSNNTGGTFNFAPATFTVNVAPPPNTPPHVSVTGVTGGASYEFGTVPAATCQVTDAEDGNSSFAATLSAISGPLAAYGLGEQTASCSYTDAGGLTASASITYGIVDTTRPVLSLPADITAEATSSSGAVVAYSAFATDAVNGPVTVNCTPDSGSTFSLGTTTVNCSATDEADNAATGSFNVTVQDTTAPTITDNGPTASPDGTNGWYIHPVTNLFEASDAVGFASPTTNLYDFSVSSDTAEGSAITIPSGTVTDAAGNTNPGINSAAFKIDLHGPEVQCGAADNDWHGSDVTINCTAEDSTSGLADPADASFSLSTNVAAGDETDNASTGNRPVLDVAGNSTTAGPITGIKVDKKAPEVSCSPSAADGLWHPDNVSFACIAADGGSGLADQADASFVLSTSEAVGTETDNASTDSRIVTDGVGNSVTVAISGNKIDMKSPVVQCGSADGQWHATDVSIGCTSSDEGSGLANSADASFSLSTNVSADTETDNAPTGSHEVADAVGNSTTAGPISGIKVDKKAPTITSTNVTVILHQTATATYNCTDGGSGVATCIDSFGGTSAAPGTLDTSSVGNKTFTVTATDSAGNSTSSSITYHVIYNVPAPNSGVAFFLQPINDTAHQQAQMSIFRAGSTVPVKFQLKDFSGNIVQANAAPQWLIPTVVGTTTAPIDESTYSDQATTGSTYRWDSTAQQYIYNWGTPRNGAGNCYRIGVLLDDGQTIYVNIGLR